MSALRERDAVDTEFTCRRCGGSVSAEEMHELEYWMARRSRRRMLCLDCAYQTERREIVDGGVFAVIVVGVVVLSIVDLANRL